MNELKWDWREHSALWAYAAKWLLLACVLSAAVGTACAWFLLLLDRATRTRFEHPALLYGLPLAGVAVALLYQRLGPHAEGGNNLIVDEIHEPGAGVPARMAPMVFVGTIATHLCGGSAGREGTAIQMGGSIAAFLARLLSLGEDDRRTLLMAGVAGGFGAVFGTPLAGAVFAMEVLAIGSLRYDALLPCLATSLLSDWVCRTAWSVRHSDYHMSSVAVAGGALLLGKVALAGVCFGLVGALFAALAHRMQALFRRIPSPLLRPVAGAAVVIALTAALGTRQYLGLGVTSPDPGDVTIFSSFNPGGAGVFSWLWKSLFTAVTLGSGFKGGEVTPLFFVGASLGNALSVLFHEPASLFAALGFVAVFAGATNTPLACTIMGVELFGAEHVVPLALACFVSYLFSGHSGIYKSQRVAAPKPGLRALRR